MRYFYRSLLIACCATLPLIARCAPPPEERAARVPAPLKGWEAWAIWDSDHRDCPMPFNDAKKHLCFWPSRLTLKVDAANGRFDLGVTVFHETWIPLPGSGELWPFEVKANGAPVPVVARDGVPSVQLTAGAYRLEGSYRWEQIPQQITLPRDIGVLSLTLNGQPVETPAWDAVGSLWLKRETAVGEEDKDFLAVKVYAALEDGIPLWLRTEVELIVSGKSREEDLGGILPEGWKLAALESPIPVAVDDAGRMKAQVRAGKWTIRADAFRLDDVKEFRYAPGVKPAAEEELVAFRSKPELRMVEIVGAPSIDVSQTTFPEKWRELPVYRWDTAGSFKVEERMRGMGLQKPAGLNINRELWLDEDGRALTFRDRIGGQMQQIWRLDAAPGQDLGSVRSAGQGQLITRNPDNAAPGVEIRSRAVDLEATGRMLRSSALSASGWQADAETVRVSVNLPPGWRLLALFGADWVRGDWLTAWTLFDLFLLLIFTLAVFRMSGSLAAILSFLTFGLAYHEPGAPRFVWLVLLIPIALLRVVPEGSITRFLQIAKYSALTIFILTLTPFISKQVQQAIYPQLEVVPYGMQQQSATMANEHPDQMQMAPNSPADVSEPSEYSILGSSTLKRGASWKGGAKENMAYDAKARIQTGPGVPEWSWRTVSYGWNGPVAASQTVHPVLISLTVERILTALRVTFLLALTWVLLRGKSTGIPDFRRRSKATAIALLFSFCTAAVPARAEIPDKATLDTLRDRLLAPSDAFPNAAEIPNVTLTVTDRRISIDAEIHTATRAAVPLPGRLPAWSPLTVTIDGQPDVALRRADGYLWVVLPQGVHRVRVEGLLTGATEWEWTFLLKPRRVTITAPGWTFSGVRPDGVPEQQIFFVLQQKAAAGAASYDRQDFQAVAVIDRQLELGLIWQVRTTVTRLSPTGKAVALRVPLLPGENVLSANAVARDGFIEIRLGANEPSFTWESGLAVTGSLKLAARAEDAWVERWRLVASPVWNVTVAGLAPTFEVDQAELIPVWQPWPGESVELAVSRPEAIPGATVTVDKATHEITLGKRQRTSNLTLSLRCSLGEDFLIDLPGEAEITSLLHNGQAIPVRRDGGKLIIPLRPGQQSVAVSWKINGPLGSRAVAESVRLPVESANLETVINVPDDRWVLWAHGPVRGPAVRFWVLLACALIAAAVLGRLPHSPLRSLEWMLLVIGLTQVPLVAGLIVVGWLFVLAWRGRESFLRLETGRYNALQLIIAGATVVSLGILLTAVGSGLLGRPDMFIAGNGSSQTALRWFQARCSDALPTPGCLSVSIWWYRFLMLAWALWLASSLIRWLTWGWRNFSTGGIFTKTAKAAPASPPIPAHVPPLPPQP